MNNAHKVGLATLLLSVFAFAACSSDDNPSPSENGPIVVPTGGAINTGGSGGNGTGGNGTGGADNTGGLGGDSGTGGDGTGGFVKPARADCTVDHDLTGTNCWDISGKFGGKDGVGCNGVVEEQFLNQCSSGGFCGDKAFKNSTRIANYSGTLPPLP